jgi:hypothetical protein
MGDADPTELAAAELETQSVQAWGLADEDDDVYPPASRFTSGRITAAAVTASLAVVAVAGLVAWQHLRQDESVPTAATASMVPATVPVTPPATPIAAPPPAPPAVTVTTVIKEVPQTPGWLPHTAVPAPRPTASGGTSFTTYIGWDGTDCIDIRYPNGNAMPVQTSCNPTHTQTVTHTLATPGRLIGADPIMGNATSIACRVMADASQVTVSFDSGTAGDGHDVNCIVPAP